MRPTSLYPGIGVAGLALGCLLAPAQGQDAPQPPSDSVMLVHQARTAYFVAAPPPLAASMQRAVAAFCETAGDTARAPVAWLCDRAPLGFLREVDVLGTELQTGLACREESLEPGIRFHLVEMIDYGRDCVPVRRRADSGAHFVSAEDLLFEPEEQDAKPYGEFLAYTSGCVNCHHQTHRSIINAPPLLIVRSYTLAEFRKLLKTGITRTGRDMTAEASVMGIVAKEQFAHFTEDDVAALFAFLTTDWTAGRAREEEKKIPILYKPLIDKGELPPP